jgi:hypothetical protein
MTEKQAIKQMNQVEYQANKLATSYAKLRDNITLGSSSEEFIDAGKRVCAALTNLENELLK